MKVTKKSKACQQKSYLNGKSSILDLLPNLIPGITFVYDSQTI